MEEERFKDARERIKQCISLYQYRQGFNFYTTSDTRLISRDRFEYELSVSEPLETFELTLLRIIASTGYIDTRTLYHFALHEKRAYGISIQCEPGQIAESVKRFARLHLIHKREQRAGIKDHEVPINRHDISGFCITERGGKEVRTAIQFNGFVPERLSELNQVCAYEQIVMNFAVTCFYRAYKELDTKRVPDKQMRLIPCGYRARKGFGNDCLHPAKVVFPADEGENRRVVIFDAIFTKYDTSLMRPQDIEGILARKRSILQSMIDEERDSDAEHITDVTLCLICESYAELKKVSEYAEDYYASCKRIVFTTEGALRSRGLFHECCIERGSTESTFKTATNLF